MIDQNFEELEIGHDSNYEPSPGDKDFYEYWIKMTKHWIKEIESQSLGTSDSDYIHVQKLKAQLDKLIKEEKENNANMV